MSFKKVDRKVSFPEIEKEILKFWQKNKIFEETQEKKEGQKNFVFYEGPPTANGKPGIHHVLARSFKDLYPRYKTMQGFYCLRRGGWDCHGLPVELEIEKELGFSGKKDIEKYGIDKFNAKCRESVFRYIKDWEDLTRRMGFWIDLEHSYFTLTNEYIETCWWLLSEFYKKDLLVRDYKVLPYCTRCGTPLSSHELSLGYQDKEDVSVFLKFEMSREPGMYFLAWTTTPWTLPGNVALAIDPGSSYVKVEQNGEKLILAKSRTEALVGGYKVIEEFSGEKLLGESYKPLFDFAKYEEKAYYLIDGSDFVSTDEGTGIVHTAVMYGAEDFLVGKKTGLPEKHTVDLNGKFSPEVKPWAGTDIFEANPLIIKDLKDRGFLYKEQPVTHSYPFCWRCHRPLIYYALESWFIKTTAEKDKIITENKKINWVPSSIKTGRMGNWLETMLDWALSRSRYWGTPLPIWICDKCGDVQIVDSIETLKKKALNPERLKGELDLHRPYIDQIKLKCDKCGGIASRVEYVLDCWFDSGSMPYGQWHYPFENKEEFEEQFPANFISEAQDQTRGWFYTLLVISSLVTGKASYKNVVCPNLVLDEKGQKMSKSLGNAVDPWEVMDKFGADATRWYFYSSVSLGNEYRFGFKSVEEVVRRFLLTLWNTYNFFVTYANIDGWEPGNDLHPNKNVLDQWMTSKLNRLIAELTKSLDGYNAFEASSLIENFVSDFSTWYIRRSRDRIGPTTVNSDDKNDCFSTLHHTLVILSQLLAPFTPFIAEEIYKNLTGEKSVHLSIWPVSDNELIDDGLEEQMELVRRINEIGHSIRKENLIKVRQPLQSIKVSFSRKLTDERLIQLIKEELNVKSVVFSEEKVSELSVELDTVITPELEREGEAREQVREIQIARKEKGYELNEKINITLPSWPEEFEEYIKRETLAINLKKGHFGIEKP